MMRHALILASLLSIASCGGGSSPSAPTPTPPLAAGTWRGPLTTANPAVSGTLELVLTQQTNGSVGGTASLTLPGLSLPNGSVTGAVDPGAAPPTPIGLAITVSGSCAATLSAPSTFSTRTNLNGVIAGGNPACGLDVSGSFTLQKQ